MADDLDKFVLQYTVELKDSIKRLEQLNSKVAGVNKASGKAGKGLKEFANGAADELGKMIPGVDKAAAAVRMLGVGFSVAATAVAALGVGIKSVMDLREQYNAQRVQGREQGVSALRLEEYQRKFAKSSNGYVSREKVADQVSAFSNTISEAYADPTRLGTANRRLRMLGIDVGARGTPSITTNAALTQLAQRFQGMEPEQVQGLAKSYGMDPDFALTLQKLGPSVGKITEQTPADIAKRQQAEQQLDKFNDSMAQLKEQFKEAETVLGQKLLPAFGKLVDLFTRLAQKMPDLNKDVSRQATKAENFAMGKSNPLVDMLNGMLFPKSGAGFIAEMFKGIFAPEKYASKEALAASTGNTGGSSPDERDEKSQSAKNKEKKDKETANALADAADKANEEGKQNADAMNLAVNMFAGAVATFANAIDEKQAWAAWAGEVGHAAGLGPQDDGNKTYMPTAPSKYDDLFAKASKVTGVPVDLLKRVTNVESKFDPNATSAKGAQGLMQVMPSNFKSLGIKNGYDPEQNIMGGAKLLKEYLANSSSVREALMKYHGGYDQSGWGKNTYAYPDKVLGDSDLMQGTSGGTIHGESKAKTRLRTVQQNIATRLGLPNVQQLQQGGVSRGDTTWAVDQLDAGIQNQISALKTQLQQAGLPQQTRSKIMNDIRDQQSGLAQLRTYGGIAEERSPEGPRSITIGERAIVINVIGAGNPSQTAEVVMDKLHQGMGELANATDTGVKR